MTGTSVNEDRLFELLPALYRIADADPRVRLGDLSGADGARGSAEANQLRELLRLITRESDALYDATQQLWDDFFIETCQRWVVPYIGELVGNILLHDLDSKAAAATAESIFADLSPDLRAPGAIPIRADVAKTIYYRRRKGTPPMLEELARDVTGWDAHVVEFFTRLRWNQHLEHLRLDSHACPDLRRVDVGDRAGGPWDTTTHTVDVRQINQWDGWYNIPNIGFFLWRLDSYLLRKVRPRAIGSTPWRLTFSPLGQDNWLFSAGRREPDESGMATELHVRAPVRAAAFFEDLNSIRHRALIDGTPLPAVSDYYGNPAETEASFAVFYDGAPIAMSDIECANLDGWIALTTQPAGTTLKIDAKRGRLLVPDGYQDLSKIMVSYYFGFSSQMGGGEYSRSKWLVTRSDAAPIAVHGGGNSLDAAIAAVAATPPTVPPTIERVVIHIEDNETYDVAADIMLRAGEALTIQAVDGARPHLRLMNGSIAVDSAGADASLTLGGLLIEGGLRIEGDLRELRLLHTTLVPGRSVLQEPPVPVQGPSLEVADTKTTGTVVEKINTHLDVQIAFSITGALRIPAEITRLTLLDSIVDGIDQNDSVPNVAIADATNASGPPAHIERSTIFGKTRFLKLPYASESIFTDQILVDQRQEGCLRFSYVTRDSATPQQYRCQPALEIATETERRKTEVAKTGATLPAGWEMALTDEVVAWLVPSFGSIQYGHYAFAQLHLLCPAQIRTGAEDGSEMGAFCVLKQPQRESNLRMRLDEYLPIGLEAGIIYVT